MGGLSIWHWIILLVLLGNIATGVPVVRLILKALRKP